MSYDVWLFAPTYACISTKLSLYLVNKALSLHNILVFSFHAYRTRQMSMNGGTKNDIRQLCTFHISGNLLLYGAVELDYATNCKLFDAVHNYIDETGRL